MAEADVIQIGYRSGTPGDRLGRFELTVRPDGGARLDHRDVTGLRVWTARLEHAVWARLIDALDRSGFPAIQPAPIPPGGAHRELSVGPTRRLVFGWKIAEPALGEVFRVLDALVRQVSGGALRTTVDELPHVAHRYAREAELSEPASVASDVAAFGTLEGRPACVVAGAGVRILALPGQPPLDLKIHGGGPSRAVALIAAGGRDLLAQAGDDGVIRVRDARTGEVLHARAGHRGPVAGVTATEIAGRPVVLSAGADGELRMWAGEVSAGLGAIAVQGGGLTSICHARVAGRDLLCAGADDGGVRLWDAADDATMVTLGGHLDWVNAVAMTEHEERGFVASGGADHTVRIWDTADGREVHTLAGHTDSVTGVALTVADDRLLAGSCSLDGTVRTWDAITGEPLADWPAGGEWLTGIGFVHTGDGPALVTAGTDGAVRLWEAVTGALVAELTSESVPSAVATATIAGRWAAAVGYKDGSLRIWRNGTLARTLPPSDGAITAVGFGPDGLISGTDDGTVRVHEIDGGGELHVPTPHTAPVLSLASVEDLLVSGGADGTVRVWDALSGTPLALLRGHTAGVATVVTGRVGDRAVIASGGYDRIVRTWDAASGEPLLAIHGHMYPVYALAFGGGLLASASYDGVVRVWDATTGTEVGSLPGNDGMIRGLCFEGDDLAVAAEDGAVRLWRLPAGELVEEFKVPYTPLAVSFSGGRAYVAGHQGPAPV